jgi:hypothetical protein
MRNRRSWQKTAFALKCALFLTACVPADSAGAPIAGRIPSIPPDVVPLGLQTFPDTARGVTCYLLYGAISCLRTAPETVYVRVVGSPALERWADSIAAIEPNKRLGSNGKAIPAPDATPASAPATNAAPAQGQKASRQLAGARRRE